MNINEIVLCVKWVSDAAGNRPEVTTPANCSWEDITGQPARSLPCTPNVYLIRAYVTDAVYAALNGDVRYIVLARRTFDDANPGTYTSNNFDSVPSGAQLTSLKNLILARFPGVDEDKLTEVGQAIFRAGLTRAEIITLLAKRWQRFVHALKGAL